MKNRWDWAVRGVSVLGIAGLATSALYLFAVAMSFHEKGARISEFMVGTREGEWGWALPAVAIPYVLLVSYLYLRANLGHWMVDAGEFERALAYTEDKVDAGLLRSRTESHVQRTARARAMLSLERDEGALEVLSGVSLGRSRSAVSMRARYWLVIAALRRENLVEAKKALEPVKRGKSKWFADLRCLSAEVAAREGEQEKWREAIADAEWGKAREHRLAWARGVGVAKFGLMSEGETALAELETVAERLDEEVPGRAPERAVVAAEIAKLIGNDTKSSDLLRVAQNLRPGDRRSQWLLREKNRDGGGA